MRLPPGSGSCIAQPSSSRASTASVWAKQHTGRGRDSQLCLAGTGPQQASCLLSKFSLCPLAWPLCSSLGPREQGKATRGRGRKAPGRPRGLAAPATIAQKDAREEVGPGSSLAVPAEAPLGESAGLGSCFHTKVWFLCKPAQGRTPGWTAFEVHLMLTQKLPEHSGNLSGQSPLCQPKTLPRPLLPSGSSRGGGRGATPSHLELLRMTISSCQVGTRA